MSDKPYREGWIRDMQDNVPPEQPAETDRHRATGLDRYQGIYEKYRVKRVDGRSRPGEKHEHCEYFVLDLHPEHDPHARAALLAYADSCEKEFPRLARDLRLKAQLKAG